MYKLNKKSKRIFYFDALRALAIISVIAYHINLSIRFLVIGEFAPIPSFSWFVGDFFMNYFRFGVDLFLMLAGALSLGREWTIREFLKKRLPRIIEPYLFWIFVTLAAFVLGQYLWPQIFHFIPSLTWNNIFTLAIEAFQSGNTLYYGYWFFWMIMGTYFIMPIVNKWLLHSDIKEAEYFLMFTCITSIFSFTLDIDFPVKLIYFTCPLGMVVLGYYLRHTQRKLFKTLYFPILLIIVSFILEMGISCMLSTGDFYKFNRYSITMVIKVTGIFLLFRYLDENNVFQRNIPVVKVLFKKAVFSIAKYSYGFYLLHLCVMAFVIKLLKYYTPFSRYKLLMLVIFLATLSISWIIMACLDRVPYINKVIGAK